MAINKYIYTILIFTITLTAFTKIDGLAIAKDVNMAIGKPYVWGGNNLNTGVDCSSLVKLVYAKYGYSLPRTAQMQIEKTKNCKSIYDLTETQIGDAVYFKNKQGKIHHVAIISGYTNDGVPIITHAKGKEYGVVREKMSVKYKSEFLEAKRFHNCTSSLAKIITNEEVSEAILDVANKYNIKASMVFTLAAIESNFSPLVLTIETTPKIALFLEKLRNLGLKIITGGTTFHSNLAIVNIYPTDIEMAQYLAYILKNNGYSFDLGLMQIHSTNFTLSETKDLFYPQNNLDKSMRILRDCQNSFKFDKNQIECYNRGTGNLRKALKKNITNYPYYSRYQKYFNKYFKGED